MKKSIVLATIAAFLFSSAMSQNCTPDPAITSTNLTGMFPNPAVNPNLPDGVVDVAYSTTITFVIKPDTNIDLSDLIGFPFPTINCSVNYYEVTQPVTLPSGLSTNCEPVSCQFPGGTSGCMTIEGTPTVIGTHSISIPGKYNIAIPNSVPVVGGSNQTIQKTYLPYSLTVTSVSGMEAVQNKTPFSLYPNPASEKIDIQCSENIIEIKIISLEGNVIKQLGKTTSLNVSDMANGIYFVEVITDKGSSRQKLIRQK